MREKLRNVVCLREPVFLV